MISWQTVLLRLAISAILGAVIGLERERKDWSAGMRTHMMVCVGSALVIIVSAFGFKDILGTPNVVLDPSRIAAQVISGIGFLGAGTILFLRPGFIRGLTTAAGLWVVAAIGLAVGCGMYFAAIAATVLAFVILLILQPLEKRFAKHFKQKYVRIAVDLSGNPSLVINHLMESMKSDISSFSLDRSENGFLIELKFEAFDPPKMLPVLLDIEKQAGVKEVFWSK